MKVVITGPTGTIGIALINLLIKYDYKVLLLPHKGSTRIKNIPNHPNITIIQCDANKYTSFTHNERWDIFFHFAWQGGHFREDPFINIHDIENTINAVALAHRLGCHTFIGAGSQAECGIQTQPISNNTKCHPFNSFGAAKLCANNMSLFECEKIGIRHIWARILSVYGPYDGDGTMIISTLRKMLINETANFTGGEQQWDFLFSEDAADAMFALLHKGKHGHVYPIGSGIAYSLKHYIEKMKTITNSNSTLGFGKYPYKKNEIMFLKADLKDLHKDTGWEPKTTFEEGIRLTINYLKKAEK